MTSVHRLGCAALALLGLTTAASANAAEVCRARSGPTVTPVIELYTSEGCSSCPPADRWVSALKGSGAVVQAFHVPYWDYIGWTDRFADKQHTLRQREMASANDLAQIYTPQVLRNGVDWPQWRRAGPTLAAGAAPARVHLELQREGTAVVARVAPDAGVAGWQAYWTVTEDGHATRVRAGENAGEHLKHDAVVRQYEPAGPQRGAQTLRLLPRAATPGHTQRVNLVVTDRRGTQVLQALSLDCG